MRITKVKNVQSAQRLVLLCEGELCSYPSLHNDLSFFFFSIVERERRNNSYTTERTPLITGSPDSGLGIPGAKYGTLESLALSESPSQS